jgi:hypothetical protein
MKEDNVCKAVATWMWTWIVVPGLLGNQAMGKLMLAEDPNGLCRPPPLPDNTLLSEAFLASAPQLCFPDHLHPNRPDDYLECRQLNPGNSQLAKAWELCFQLACRAGEWLSQTENRASERQWSVADRTWNLGLGGQLWTLTIALSLKWN